METFLFWFGVVCAGLISFGFAMYSISVYRHVKHHSYYDGIRARISDTVNSMNEVCMPDSYYHANDVKKILIELRHGYWPDVEPAFNESDKTKSPD